MRSTVLGILEKVKPDVDFENRTDLISGQVLDSIDIMEIVSKLEENFAVEIDMEYLDAAHFDSVDAIVEMIEELS